MVGGILKHVGHAAPGQQCTQCGTQVRLLSQEWYIFLFYLYLWLSFTGVVFLLSLCLSASLHSLLLVTHTPLPYFACFLVMNTLVTVGFLCLASVTKTGTAWKSASSRS